MQMARGGQDIAGVLRRDAQLAHRHSDLMHHCAVEVRRDVNHVDHQTAPVRCPDPNLISVRAAPLAN